MKKSASTAHPFLFAATSGTAEAIDPLGGLRNKDVSMPAQSPPPAPSNLATALPATDLAATPASLAAPATPVAVATTEMSEPPRDPDDVMIMRNFFGTVDGALVAMVFAIGLTLIARTIQAFLLHSSLRKAIEAQSPHAGDLVDKINRPAAARRGASFADDRAGIVLTAIGLAMVGFGLILGEQEAIAAALFPLFVGLGLLLRFRMVARAALRNPSAE
jgi:hypothetical protein